MCIKMDEEPVYSFPGPFSLTVLSSVINGPAIVSDLKKTMFSDSIKLL